MGKPHHNWEVWKQSLDFVSQSQTEGVIALLSPVRWLTKMFPTMPWSSATRSQQIGWACECDERLSDDLECLACDRHYQKGSTGLSAKSGW